MAAPRLQSGKFHERPLLPRAIIRRPFATRQVPDVTTKTYEQHYLVTRARYSPALASHPAFTGAYLGPSDTAVTNAYLVYESDPDDDIINATLARVKRVFALVPPDQVSYDTRPFARPSMHDLVSGTTYAVSFDEGATSHLFTSRKTVSSISDLVFTVDDTFRIYTRNAAGTAFGDHTISCDSSGNTIYNAILASSTLLGLSAVQTPTSIALAWGSGVIMWHNTSADIIVTELSAISFKIELTRGRVNERTGTALRTVNSTSHGGVAGDMVALWNGDKLVGVSRIVSAATNSFTVRLDDLPGQGLVVTHCQFAKNGTRYVNGAKDCTIRITEKFYAPGITGGITTGADIPSVPVYTDPIAWLGRIVAGASYAAINVSPIESYAGFIVSKRTEEVQMADALETRTAAA